MAGEFYLGLDILTYGASWASALETVELADRLGYDGVYTADHLFATDCEAVGRDPTSIRRLPGAKLIVRPTRAAADREFERQLAVQPWSGEVLQHIAAIGLWQATASGVTDAIGALQSAGAGGFIAQVYPPYDHETIEALASVIAPRVGWQPRGVGGRVPDGAPFA